MYWIEILREYFDKNNLEDFKRLCVIVLILWDFKRIFLKDFLQSGFLTQDFKIFKIVFVKIFSQNPNPIHPHEEKKSLILI